MKGPINIYYDNEGDFLEITISNPPEKSFVDDINEDIFIRKDSKTNEIIGIGILNFIENSKDLKDILANIPIRINFDAL